MQRTTDSLLMLVLTGATLGTIAVTQASAQLPPIYENAPVELVPTRTIATFPVNTFLENLVVDRFETLYITSHEDGKIIQITSNGRRSVYATVNGKVAGITLTPDGSLLVTGWNADQVPTVFRVPFRGRVETIATLRDAIFLNGLVHLSDGRYLIADSYKGAIWELNTNLLTAQIWLEDPLLARRTSESQIPGVNGLKIFEGALYASNTDRMLMLKIPINQNGRPEAPSVFAEEVNIDDFAFDTNGTLYGATHIYNSIVRITPDRQITVLAQAPQGLTGSTAVAFGRMGSDYPSGGTAPQRTSLYAVTNGGMFLPPPTGVQPAQVIRLEIGNPGAALP